MKAPRVTFGQIETVLKEVPVDLLPEVYAYLVSLMAADRYPLRDKPVRDAAPADSVAENDWNALHRSG